jgi:hypothetical protein
MIYIYISKPRQDRGIYKVDKQMGCRFSDGVMECTNLKGVSGFLFDETQAEKVTFHHFLSERYLLLEDKNMKVNLTVGELCNFVEEWEKFNFENK